MIKPKIKKIIKIIICIPLAGLIIIILKLLHPLVFIRLGKLRSDRMGHFVADTCLIHYYYEKNKSDTVDLYWVSFKTVNKYWRELAIKIIPYSYFAIFYYPLLTIFPKSRHIIKKNPAEELVSTDKEGFLNKFKSIINFSNYENSYAWKILEDLNIKKGSKFVCYQIRDSSYLEHLYNDIDFSYHSFRDSDISTYLKSMRFLSDEGFFVFRMGKVVKNKLISNNEKIIDYANSKIKSDFMDVWLMANCSFCITSGSGLDEVSVYSKIPLLYINLYKITAAAPSSRIMVCPKKFYKKNGRKVNFEFYIDSANLKKNEDKKYKIIDLTSEEILSTTKDFLNLYKNKFKLENSRIDINSFYVKKFKKHKFFKSYFKKNNFNQLFLSKIFLNWIK